MYNYKNNYVHVYLLRFGSGVSSMGITCFVGLLRQLPRSGFMAAAP